MLAPFKVKNLLGGGLIFWLDFPYDGVFKEFLESLVLFKNSINVSKEGLLIITSPQLGQRKAPLGSSNESRNVRLSIVNIASHPLCLIKNQRVFSCFFSIADPLSGKG